ncbi:hypothetical protein JCM9152_1414 [Halalkalibacter hemicellulosilyticusJCM 9152]|uniref:Uncharacterized protein n=1 Tax=Halalkalibacter hemicellulosilyticusJCM 9152 TaxID=1236971 RepID=W4QD88_9BACI|nr:hypothetical protein JCM9152_1414 [Halalkalibacter hemicellulosilyticusJCM 9152]
MLWVKTLDACHQWCGVREGSMPITMLKHSFFSNDLMEVINEKRRSIKWKSNRKR